MRRLFNVIIITAQAKLPIRIVEYEIAESAAGLAVNRESLSLLAFPPVQLQRGVCND